MNTARPSDTRHFVPAEEHRRRRRAEGRLARKPLPSGECRHCHAHSGALRPRGLCWHCYEAPAVRGLYPSAHGKYSSHKHGMPPDHNGEAAVPEPTRALPGTEEKVRVLEERAAKGESLFHRGDGPCDS